MSSKGCTEVGFGQHCVSREPDSIFLFLSILHPGGIAHCMGSIGVYKEEDFISWGHGKVSIIDL